jgi:hypothetical protein
MGIQGIKADTICKELQELDGAAGTTGAAGIDDRSLLCDPLQLEVTALMKGRPRICRTWWQTGAKGDSGTELAV